MTELDRMLSRALTAKLSSAFALLILAWPAQTQAEDWRTQIFIPTMPTLRSWQNILTIEGTGGLYPMASDNARRIMRARNLGALALMRGARMRLTMGRNRIWAWALTATGGQSTVVDRSEMNPNETVNTRGQQLSFGRLSGGGMLRYGDMRTVYLHTDIGAQWMGHASSSTPDFSEHDMIHEFSAVFTVGVGYDMRLSHHLLIGVNLSSSWIALSTLRRHGLQSVDGGLRLGVAWL